jgi:flagellar motor switch protein FliG
MNSSVMTNSANLRKAAVLLRSLDGDTAAIMLAQLSPAEAASLRAAIRNLGTIDVEEQADVAAEFRRTRPAMASQSAGGVELELSTSMQETIPFETNGGEPAVVSAKRFEFLANAPTSALVPYLSREHAQTIAVVLAHLAPARAAAVLAALPEKLQADTIERLSELGETDPDSLTALERELAAWMATRTEDRGTIARRRETVTNILAATDAKTRRGILSKLKTHNGALAAQFGQAEEPVAISRAKPQAAGGRYESTQASDTSARIQRQSMAAERPVPSPQPVVSRPAPLPRIEFDHLIHLDAQGLTAVLRDVDANVLAIALVGSQAAFIDRICKEMPKRIGRDFRRELRKVGPTRLSDVEAAQRIVADAAARHLAQRRGLATSRS